MPADQLFDMSLVNWSSPMITSEQIRAIIPHRGPIAMLDRVVWHDDTFNLGVGVHDVPHEPWWADGHVPGYPLMPGVLMVEAAAQLASVLYYKRSGATYFAGFTRIDDVRFRGQVRPGDQLVLLNQGEKYNSKRFVTRIQGLVDDQIVFEGCIAGMIFPQLGNMQRVDTPHGVELRIDINAATT